MDANFQERTKRAATSCQQCKKSVGELPEGQSLRSCSRCGIAQYCSRACAGAAWPQHVRDCTKQSKSKMKAGRNKAAASSSRRKSSHESLSPTTTAAFWARGPRGANVVGFDRRSSRGSSRTTSTSGSSRGSSRTTSTSEGSTSPSLFSTSTSTSTSTTPRSESPQKSSPNTATAAGGKVKFRLIPKDAASTSPPSSSTSSSRSESPTAGTSPSSSSSAPTKVRFRLIPKNATATPPMAPTPNEPSAARSITTAEMGTQTQAALTTSVEPMAMAHVAVPPRHAMISVENEAFQRLLSENDSSQASKLESEKSKCWENYFLELHKKFRAVIRKSANGAPIHVHDLKLCLDLFELETLDKPGHRLCTHHVESAMIEQRILGGKKLQLSQECISELKSWEEILETRAGKKKDRARSLRAWNTLPVQQVAIPQQQQQPYRGGSSSEQISCLPTKMPYRSSPLFMVLAKNFDKHMEQVQLDGHMFEHMAQYDQQMVQMQYFQSNTVVSTNESNSYYSAPICA